MYNIKFYRVNYLLMILLSMFCFFSCANLPRNTVKLTATSQVKIVNRSLAQVDQNCNQIIAKLLIDLKRQEQLDKDMEVKIKKFWKNLENNSIFENYGNFRRWALDKIRNFNNNPAPISFIKNKDEIYVKIGTLQKYYQGNSAFQNSPIDQIHSDFLLILERFRSFENDMEKMQRAALTLDLQIKQLKNITKKSKFPIKFKLTKFRETDYSPSESFSNFYQVSDVHEKITKLKIQKTKIMRRKLYFVKSGAFVDRQIEQSSDLESLTRLRKVVTNLYDAKKLELERTGNEIPPKLKELYSKLEDTLNFDLHPHLIPDKSYRSSLLGKQLRAEINEMFVVIKKNKAVRDLSEFYNSMSDEQLRSLHLLKTKKRLTNLIGQLMKNKIVVLATMITGGGTSTTAIVVFIKDWMMTDMDKKGKCLIVGDETTPQAQQDYIDCLDSYFSDKYDISHAIEYLNNNYEGISKVLDVEKIKEFKRDGDEFKILHQQKDINREKYFGQEEYRKNLEKIKLQKEQEERLQ